jgi:hypothetical protein
LSLVIEDLAPEVADLDQPFHVAEFIIFPALFADLPDEAPLTTVVEMKDRMAANPAALLADLT